MSRWSCARMSYGCCQQQDKAPSSLHITGAFYPGAPDIDAVRGAPAQCDSGRPANQFLTASEVRKRFPALQPDVNQVEGV